MPHVSSLSCLPSHHLRQGVKSPTERFAGADETFTIEALMPNGWALQSGTSHFLGQNFARAFDVYFQTAEGGRELVWATSWGTYVRTWGMKRWGHYWGTLSR